jgi:3-hydroxy-3-methylglutaryl CoA synthase
VAGLDEDAITMAVEAARDSLRGDDSDLGAAFLGSPTLPFADPLNSGVMAATLGLAETITCQDVTGSERARKEPVLGLTHNLGGVPRANLCSVSILGRNGA